MYQDMMPVGYLLRRAEGAEVYFEAKWRDTRGDQRKRRLGKAWLVKIDDGYERRRGRVRRVRLVRGEQAKIRESFGNSRMMNCTLPVSQRGLPIQSLGLALNWRPLLGRAR